jgi:capsular exopolysaccharide synthesis family protein
MRQGGPTLASYLTVLRRRAWIVLLCAILVPAAATYFSVRQTPEYQASAEVYINKQNLASALTGIEDTTLFVDEERAAETQASLASVPEVARGTLRLAHVTDRTPEEFLEQASVEPKGLTDILKFSVTDEDAALAEKLATAYAQAFTAYRGRLDTESLARAHGEVSDALERMKAEGREDEELYRSLEQNQQQLQTLQTLQTSRVYVVRQAGEAVQVAPTSVRNGVLGLALGLILGLGLAFLVEALDTRIRSAADVAERLGLTLLSRLPTPPRKLQKRDRLVMLAESRDPRAESYRMLATNLEFATLDSDVRSILVASAVEGEGKSTTAANLAVTMARAGKRVALVDLDLRRPYLHRFFELGGRPGVTNVALGDASLEDALAWIDLGDALGDLHVLATGPLPPDPGEFVGTHQLREIVMRLREDFDVVVVDSPPLLQVGDAMRLSAHVDGVLIVTQLNLVRRRMLSELRQLLDAIPARKLGFVVTGAQREESTGYAYGYGYARSEHDVGSGVGS